MSVRSIVRGSGLAGVVVGIVAAAGLATAGPASAATDFFRITNFDSKLVLTADSATPGARVTQQPISQAAADRQQWSIQTNSGTAALTYRLRAGSNLCLDLPRDVDRSQQRAGEKVVVRTCDGTTSQQWQDVNTTSSSLNLQNKLSQMKIDIDNNRPLDVGAVAFQNDVSRPSQRFFRVKAASV
jgi:hypothetical protein